MRASSLVVALLAARFFALAGRDLPASVWLPSALAWHDVAIGAAFWILDRASRRSRLMWLPYWTVVIWAAINVPVIRALSTPLTVPMLRAADGPLLDSIAHYVTIGNVAAMAAVVAIAVAGPRIAPRIPLGARAFVVVLVLLVAGAGPIAARRVDTRGLERNAVTAILTTLRPRIESMAAAGDWRASPFGTRERDDLSRFRGAAKGRNVVLVILESAGAQYLKPYGASVDPMPMLSALADHAIVFETAYATYPESIKGLFALMCSRHPGVDVPPERLAAAPCEPLAAQLSRRGYRTGLFHSGRFGYLGMDAVIAPQGFETRADAGAIGGQARSSFGVDEPSTVAHMLRWVDDVAGAPFFLTYMPIAGHHPYATPEPGPFKGEGEQSAYLNALLYGDRAIGALIDGLRARGVFGRTLFVVVGDHGEAFGQHDGNFGHSIFLYDENVRVPLVIAMPGVIPAPVRAGQIASIVDLAPTILDLLSAPIPSAYEGGSLLSPRDRMALFFTDYSLTWIGLRDGCWKYLLRVDTGGSHLFDVCRDPGETQDRAAGEAARVSEYRQHLERWSGAVRESYR